jgi:signal transduction histidine kinase
MRKNTMFRLVRYFSVTSFVVFVIAVSFFASRSRIASINDLITVREQSNAELAQVYANIIWADYGEFIASAATLDTDDLRNSPTLAALDTILRTYTAGLSVIKIKIYAPNGITVYSSDLAQIGEDKSANPGFVTALSGGVASELIYRDTFNAFEGAIVDRNIVESYVALRPSGTDRIYGVIEVYDDVTPLMQLVDMRQRRIVTGLVIIFTLLYIILFFIVSYAERILRRQGQEIRTQNAELVQVNQKLHHAHQLAAESARLKSEFLSTMSHELRTPLNAVIGYSGIIIEGITGETNQRTLGMIQKINMSGQHLLTLINNVLDIAKIESGRMELVESSMNIRHVVEDVQAQIQILAENKGLTFNTHIAADVPQAVIGDADRIKQILINLLSNGVKFTEQGSVLLNIEWKNTYMLLQVTDTGIGIPAHAQDYIFEEFRQVNSSSTRTYQGTGLGLAIVRKFVEAMKGTILLKSEVGSGSTFMVRLPLKVETSERSAG